MTSGGDSHASGSHPRATLAAVAILSLYALIQLYANVGSILADTRNSGGEVEPWKVWATEGSSLAGWVVVVALLWRALPHMTPPARRWPVASLLLGIGAPLASAIHVAVMVMLREAIWATNGLSYVFPDGLAGWPYELRKDVPDYILFVLVLGALRWYRRRPATDLEPVPEPAARILTAVDGSKRSAIPLCEIDWIEAAGNYVEIHTDRRTILHRATLRSIEAELGDAEFVRVDRSRMVRRAAIREWQTLQSGDFELTLSDGTQLRGSRRYRERLEP